MLTGCLIVAVGYLYPFFAFCLIGLVTFVLERITKGENLQDETCGKIAIGLVSASTLIASVLLLLLWLK